MGDWRPTTQVLQLLGSTRAGVSAGVTVRNTAMPGNDEGSIDSEHLTWDAHMSKVHDMSENIIQATLARSVQERERVSDRHARGGHRSRRKQHDPRRTRQMTWRGPFWYVLRSVTVAGVKEISSATCGNVLSRASRREPNLPQEAR